jgi:hypothetical protein
MQWRREGEGLRRGSEGGGEARKYRYGLVYSKAV